MLYIITVLLYCEVYLENCEISLDSYSFSLFPLQMEVYNLLLLNVTNQPNNLAVGRSSDPGNELESCCFWGCYCEQRKAE